MSKRGAILPTIIFIMLGLSIVALSLTTISLQQLSTANRDIYRSNAILVAEAGAEQTLNQLNIDNDFSGYSTPVEFFNNQVQGRSTYETTIEQGSVANEKVITSTANVYSNPSSSTPTSTRKVRLVVTGTSTSSDRAIHTGPGGLVMTGSATIANGPVYVNGGITMSGAARIGSASVPVDVFVANYRCPLNSPYTSYPALCDSSQGDPITANIYSNLIYGDVCATHQTTGSFMHSSGLQPNCTAPTVELPTHDRSAVVDNYTSTQTGSTASCGGATTKSWPANLRITGNVTIGSSCTLTINGNVWISGNLTLNGAARIIVADGLTTPPEIIVDGSSGVTLGGSGRIIANNQNTAALVVTYYSADSSCRPDCVTVTGANLKNSESITTVNISGAAQAPGTLFYARWTRAIIAGSGSTGGVIAQRVDLSGAGNVVFGTHLSSGTSVWSIRNYQQIFD